MKFLTPTISKIVAAIIIFLVSPTVFLFHGLDADWGPNWGSIFPFGGLVQLYGISRLYFPNRDLLFYNATFFLLGLLFSYLLACLIIHSPVVKTFLKPTLKKLGLFIFLFLLIINILPCSFAGDVPPGPYVSGWTTCGSNIIFYGLGGWVTDGGYSFLGIANLGQYGIPIFAALIIVSYLTSCSLVYLYKKE